MNKIQKLKEISQKFYIKNIFLFGSQAKKTNRPNSDVDLAIINEKDLTTKQEAMLTHQLSQVLKIPDYKLDINLLKNASPLLLGQVAKYGKKIYGSKKNALHFKLYALKIYQDNKKFFELNEKYINKHI